MGKVLKESVGKSIRRKSTRQESVADICFRTKVQSKNRSGVGKEGLLCKPGSELQLRKKLENNGCNRTKR